MKKSLLILLFIFSMVAFSCNFQALQDDVNTLKNERHQYQETLDLLKTQNEQLQTALDALIAQGQVDTETIEQLRQQIKSNQAKAFATIVGAKLNHVYQSDYDYFQITDKGEFKYWGMSGPDISDMDTVGELYDIIEPEGYPGIIALVKTTAHTNYGQYCYPDYDMTPSGEAYGSPVYTHSGCYMGFYCVTEQNSFKMAQCLWSVPDHANTACAETADDVMLLFDTYGYDNACNGFDFVGG